MGDGVAYSVDDDLRYLEEQKRNQPITVSVVHRDREKNGIVSQYSWDKVEAALRDAGVIRENECVAEFEATDAGLKIKFGEAK